MLGLPGSGFERGSKCQRRVQPGGDQTWQRQLIATRRCYHYGIANQFIDGDVFVFNFCLFNWANTARHGYCHESAEPPRLNAWA
jgi:hypothetical protein